MRMPLKTLGLLPLLVLGCSAPPASEVVPRWRVEEEVRIGNRGDIDHALTEVPFLTVDDGGNIFVAQPLDRCVKEFSPDGDLLRAFGRPGQGPGEFRSIDAIGLLGDTLFVADKNNRRLSFFGPEGSLLRTVPFDWPVIDRLFAPRHADRILSDGTVFVDPSYGAPNAALGIITARPVLRMDMEGNVLLTLAEVSVENSVAGVVRGDRGLIAPEPFGDFPLLSFSRADDFFVILERYAAKSASTATMRLMKVAASGDTVVSVDIPYEPTPLPPETVEDVVGDLATSLSETGPFGTPEQVLGIIGDLVYRPDYYPPASHLVVTQEGGVLIRREDLTGPIAKWEVLSPKGLRVAGLGLPTTARVLFATDTHLWATELDEVDVSSVVRYRLIRD